MARQNHHFVQYAPEKLPHAIDRYAKATRHRRGDLHRVVAGLASAGGG